MKIRLAPARRATFLLLLSTLNPLPSTVFAQGTAFTYQGHLNDGGSPANGTNYGMIFSLHDAPTNGNQLSGLGLGSVSVSNGVFSVPLDFGANFPGADRWLEIAVRKNGGAFTTLIPRQKLSSTPYAITANNLSGSLPAGQLTGTIPATSIAGVYSSTVALDNSANSFAGNGAGLTSLNASQLTGGTVPLAALNPAVVTSNYAGAVTLTNRQTSLTAGNFNLISGVANYGVINWNGSLGAWQSPDDANFIFFINKVHGGAGNGVEHQWMFNQLYMGPVNGGHAQFGLNSDYLGDAFGMQWIGASPTNYNRSHALVFHTKQNSGDSFFSEWSETYNTTNGGIIWHLTGSDGGGAQDWHTVEGVPILSADQDSGVEIPGYLRLGFAAPAVFGTNYVLNWTNQQCIELDISQALNVTETNLNLWGHFTNHVVLTKDIYIYPGLSARALKFPANWHWENDTGTAVAPTNVAASTCAHIHLICTVGGVTNRIAHLSLSSYSPQ